MKRLLLFIPFMLTILVCRGQYTKEKITTILTDQSEKSWTVSGINTERPEKVFAFNKDNTVKIEQVNGTKKSEKWSLKSADNIRWFITVGSQVYELIISYDKKGNQYLKLTHQETDNKSSGYYEFKLTSVK